MSQPSILLTGATGFVGRALVPLLHRSGIHVRAASRSEAKPLPAGAERILWSPASDEPVAPAAFDNVSVVVHLAARVHVMKESATDPIAEYRASNVDATLALARAARRRNVRRFVFVSSVKVYGEAGHYRETDDARPAEPYGQSKLEAEFRLREFASASGMDIAIIRPPLVYGPGVQANFAALLRLVARGLPLPFGLVDNRRSYIAVDNLADAIKTIALHATPVNETFTVSDGIDLSTAELIRRIADAMERTVTLVPVPPSLLLAAARLIGKRDAAARLLGSLTFETSRAKQLLGWTPPVTIAEGLRRTVAPGAI
jgi:UDP-4-keto-D-QuiNAc 4-reductase